MGDSLHDSDLSLHGSSLHLVRKPMLLIDLHCEPLLDALIDANADTCIGSPAQYLSDLVVLQGILDYSIHLVNV